jgi:hypothetical protein
LTVLLGEELSGVLQSVQQACYGTTPILSYVGNAEHQVLVTVVDACQNAYLAVADMS